MELNTNIMSLNLSRPKVHTRSSTGSNSIEIGTCSDTGRVRENNEDSLGAAPEMNLFVLSDGMGGMACGEVASRLTVDTLLAHCREAESNPKTDFVGVRKPRVSETSNRLASGIRLANQVVYSTARENEARRGMGATVVAVQCRERRLCIAHVGDSRAYRWRNQRLEQLTQDHSLGAEQMRLGKISPREFEASGIQNILTRAVGAEPEVEVEISEQVLMDGDAILLCSDGLTHELSEKQIAGVLRDAKTAQQAAKQLVELANQAGGADNVTTIVIRQVPKKVGAFSRIGRLGRRLNIL